MPLREEAGSGRISIVPNYAHRRDSWYISIRQFDEFTNNICAHVLKADFVIFEDIIIVYICN
jgi:hypothetical protein